MSEHDIRSIFLSHLELSPDNVRKTPAGRAAFAELKASIAAHGLLENLVVRTIEPGGGPNPDQAPEGSGRYSESLDLLLDRHRAWVAFMWDRPCSAEAYAGLADLYLSHQDFEDRYERIEPGFAAYLTDAMKAYAARQTDRL